jgi:hypothetical protein
VTAFLAAFDAFVCPRERGNAGERDRGARGRAAGGRDAGRRRADVVRDGVDGYLVEDGDVAGLGRRPGPPRGDPELRDRNGRRRRERVLPRYAVERLFDERRPPLPLACWRRRASARRRELVAGAFPRS